MPDRDAAKIWIHENQLYRRNLSDDQRAMQLAELLEDLKAYELKKRAQKGGETGGKNHPKVSLGDTASPKLNKERNLPSLSRKHKVSERKTRKSSKLRKFNPELAQKVKDGEIGLNAAGTKTHKYPRRIRQGRWRRGANL